MVAALRFLNPSEVRIELVLGREQCAIDPLQLRSGLVAAPIGSGHVGQTEGADLLGRLDVTTTAQIGEIGVCTDTELVRLGGELVDQLLLERLIAEAFPRLLNRDLSPDKAMIAPHLFAHPPLNVGQIFRSQRTRQIEVVVEAGIDRRADGDFAVGEHLQHHLGQHVRGRMPHPTQPLLVVNLFSCRHTDLAHLAV